MKVFAVVLALCGLLGLAVHAQQKATLTFDQLFPPEKQQALGLHKLTQTEKVALREHLQRLCALAVRGVASRLNAMSWKKTEVVPVVLVKPGIGGFVPVVGTSIANTWPKSQVKPVLLVKPGIGGFVPREGTSIGNTFRKEDTLPVILVEASAGTLVPLGQLQQIVRATSAVIESQIDADFEGWEGETIVKLTNGQIWQQTEYYYHYHYAFMPKVIIFRSGGGYKMKVDGVEKAVGVRQLR